jgi:hypothetical protein
MTRNTLRRMSRLFLCLGLLPALACSSFAVRQPDRGWEGGTGERPGVAPDRQQASAPRLDTREMCRAAARPDGWIVVSYLRLGDQCQKVGDEPFNGVLLQKISGRPVGTVLEICADQVIPRDWHEISGPVSAHCEGANVKEGQPTTIRIRKFR